MIVTGVGVTGRTTAAARAPARLVLLFRMPGMKAVVVGHAGLLDVRTLWLLYTFPR